MTAKPNRFNLTRLEAVVSGTGAVEVLGEEMDARGAERVLVTTTRSLVDSRSVERVRAALGSRFVGVGVNAGQHSPTEGVRAIADDLRRYDADAVVSLGGGSVIDSTQVAVASVVNGRDMTKEAGTLQLEKAFGDDRSAGFLHIAVPTTLSAGAFTPAAGVLDVATRNKAAVILPWLQPAVVVHDPQVTLETPRALWLSTGIRALDHAVEALYSRKPHVLGDALAVEAIRMLFRHLPLSAGTDEASLEHRTACLDAAWLSLYGGFNTGLGLSHALSHQLGPRWDVAHGVSSCITLPPSMEVMAEISPQRFEKIAAALSIPFDPAAPEKAALESAQAVDRFIRGLDLPMRLRDVGVPHEELTSVAEATRIGLEIFDATDRPVTTEEIVGLLERCY
ncbi:iron-containing alcohol dehydrogenase [Geodermatophilus sp. URMC 62]|uniref:iron-containing alcohol dehydrogenase n=1 Tax=Geodermatophilus sp. URMC 62 TaxID=3423414 RepID=UPI00406C0595